MRLLVSVRDAREAARAVAGGAEIIDAKEPTRGSIAPVDATTLRAIAAAVPDSHRLSTALGDVASAEDLERAFGDLPPRLSFVKLGFRGIDDAKRIGSLLRGAVDHAARHQARPAVVAVAYADHHRAGSLSPSAFPYVLSDAGADGLLIDTCFKDRGDLFAAMSPADLAAIGSALEADEATFALGGSLGVDQVRMVAETGATVFGVRGAVCRGGRAGEVDEDLVRRLAEAVRRERASAPS